MVPLKKRTARNFGDGTALQATKSNIEVEWTSRDTKHPPRVLDVARLSLAQRVLVQLSGVGLFDNSVNQGDQVGRCSAYSQVIRFFSFAMYYVHAYRIYWLTMLEQRVGISQSVIILIHSIDAEVVVNIFCTREHTIHFVRPSFQFMRSALGTAASQIA